MCQVEVPSILPASNVMKQKHSSDSVSLTSRPWHKCLLCQLCHIRSVLVQGLLLHEQNMALCCIYPSQHKLLSVKRVRHTHLGLFPQPALSDDPLETQPATREGRNLFTQKLPCCKTPQKERQQEPTEVWSGVGEGSGSSWAVMPSVGTFEP